MIQDIFNGTVQRVFKYQHQEQNMLRIEYRPDKKTNNKLRMGGHNGLLDLNISRDIDKRSLTSLLNAKGKNIRIIEQGTYEEQDIHHHLPLQSVEIEGIPVYERVELKPHIPPQNLPEKRKSFWSRLGL